jgi:hypothetical protein
VVVSVLVLFSDDRSSREVLAAMSETILALPASSFYLTPGGHAYQNQEENDRMYLSWEPTVEYVDFVTAISTSVQHYFKAVPAEAAATAQKRPRLFILRLDDLFWKNFCALTEDEAGHVLDGLKAAPITHVYFISVRLSNHGSNLTAAEACAAFHRLCDALGAIRTITTASMDVTDDVLSGQLGYAIRALTSINNASIRVYYNDAVVNRSIASALEHHPALCTFCLKYEATHVLRTYMAVLSAIPKLEEVALAICVVSASPQSLSFNETEALVEVLRIDRPLSIEFQLDGCELTDPASHCHFCAGLSETKVQGVKLNCCEMFDAVSLARALTSSNLSAFRSSHLEFVEHGGSTDFLSTLTAGLPFMKNLEDLEVDLIESVGGEPVDCESFVRATASCPRLKRLVLSLRSNSATKDAAIAYCRQTRTNIEDNTIKGSKTAADKHAHHCSLLFEVVKKSYTIQLVRLVTSRGSNIVDLWDVDMMANTRMICRLNRSGRAYMAGDSNNQREGFKVLGAVNEDLNCLYFHLRENPLLCREQSTATAYRKRRRDGDLGSA